MEIEFSARFRKQYKRANEKIKNAFRQRLKLFKQDPYSPLLKNHPLTGNYKEYRSVNITGDWRALYREHKEEEKIIIIFQMLGTHSQLYK